MKSRFFISILFAAFFFITTTACGSRTSEHRLEASEAEIIALEHAGFTSDEVTGLHTEYDIDHAIPEYEVQFYQDHLEYEYHIHSETGEIIYFDKETR